MGSPRKRNTPSRKKKKRPFFTSRKGTGTLYVVEKNGGGDSLWKREGVAASLSCVLDLLRTGSRRRGNFGGGEPIRICPVSVPVGFFQKGRKKSKSQCQRKQCHHLRKMKNKGLSRAGCATNHFMRSFPSCLLGKEENNLLSPGT